ncbi:MAG: decarboxylating 6-phosphogluconate dehydrogenase [Candidatus Eisenbacteria bacterium]|nr:decarboxylating 6-phosphogluconate dehydrogenase [Candidatus Eisenbacteria bacterium]
MEVGMIGLGKMGLNMVKRLLEGGHSVVAHDLNAEAIEEAEASGARGAPSMAALLESLSTPRAVWIMVPAGKPTEETLNKLGGQMAEGDVVVDGGNSFYKDSMRHAATLGAKGIHFVDAGTSGGVWGLAEGYSLMVGGETEVVERLRPVLETLAPAPDKGWGHVGPAGSGHYVKMVHNGIEYGLMQAYAEGFQLLKSREDFDLDLHRVAEIWRFGSVVRSWLLDLTAAALKENPGLEGIAPYVSDSGEGRWTVMESIEQACPLPVITLALQSRFRSRIDDSFADKLLAAMRNQFGGHAMKREEE